MTDPGYVHLMDFLARALKYIASALYTLFTILLIYGVVSDWNKIAASASNIFEIVGIVVARYVVPKMGLLIAAIILSGAAVIMGMEARRAKMALISELYGELALYGGMGLQHLLSKYGFSEVSDLQEFLNDIEEKMHVRVVIDPSSGEVRLEF